MIEKDSKLCSFYNLSDRSGNTIIPLFIEKVLSNTTIITGCWSDYNRLREYPEFTRLSVNHSLNFLNPDDSAIHTQNIESSRGQCKSKLKTQNRTSSECLDGYLYEYAYKKKFSRTTCTNNFILLLKMRLIILSE
ncbi:hypothetical protein CDIK_3404 [Cucumispora dikerogammari]|nr:hypothetical protein CDIK_3404 [Cucumispora dikerogammari]